MRTSTHRISVSTAILLTTTIAHAGLYELTFSGTLDSVVDNRTTENDPFAGTAWGLDQYTPSVGDTWEYSITYDSDTLPGDVSDSHAIYGLSFPAYTSLNGNRLDLMPNTQLYFVGDEVEIFGEASATQESFSLIQFRRNDGLSDLINDGHLFTDASAFDDLQWLGFVVGANQGLFDLRASSGSGVTITVNPIPSPSTLLILGTTGLLAGRRRR